MTSMTKGFLFAAVAVLAFAISVAPSDAARKRAAKTVCSGLEECSTACKGKTCSLKTCGPEGKWTPTALPRICNQPDCPKKC
jgi:hypothetical protein